MNTQRMQFLLIFVVLLFCAACQPDITAESTFTSTTAPTSTEVRVDTLTPKPTATEVPPTYTPAPPTLTPLPEGMFFMDDFESENGIELWENQTDLPNEAIRENGILALKLVSNEGNPPFVVAKFTNELPTEEKIYFEADLLLSTFVLDESNEDVIRSSIAIALDSGEWHTECGVTGTTWSLYPYIGCFSSDGFASDFPQGTLDVWQKIRIEVDPSSMNLVYYLNNEQIGAYTLTQDINFVDSPIVFTVKAWIDGTGEGELLGRVDNIHIGIISE